MRDSESAAHGAHRRTSRRTSPHKARRSELAKDIGARIRAARSALGLTQQALAETIGISVPALQGYEAGQNLPGAIVFHGFHGLGISSSWLLTGEGPMYREGAQGGAGAGAARGGETASPRGEGEGGEEPLYKDGRELVESGEFVLVPRYDVRASAGHGAVVTSEQVVDHLAFRTEWVKRMGLDPKRLALISVVGDSMEPTLSEGDLVLIDTRITRIRSNAIYAIARGDEIVVKRVMARFDGSLKIKSDNPIYEEEEVPAPRAAELRVIGRVTWCGKRM